MIKIAIATNGEKVIDTLTKNKKDTNLSEVAVMVYRLEQVKNYLLSLKFKDGGN